MVAELHVKLAQDRAVFEPGDEITGMAAWKLEKPPKKVELRLFWFTRGKGTEDAGVVETVPFTNPMPNESRPFRLRLPESPYSFSGKLISLVWALELVAEPSKDITRLELVIAPGGTEVQLESLPTGKLKQPFFARGSS